MPGSFRLDVSFGQFVSSTAAINHRSILRLSRFGEWALNPASAPSIRNWLVITKISVGHTLSERLRGSLYAMRPLRVSLRPYPS